MSPRVKFIFWFFAGIFLLWAFSFSQEASVRQERVILKTYPFFDPDPVPRPGPIYPYFRFQGYSLKGHDVPWKMVRLENTYLDVLVAPDIGGKVWGAREKTTGRDFIYRNPVVKFREIALRGPWTSGGIEFNFGILGHAPTTATPVDFFLERNRDGSVSCVVGAIDLPSRTRWSVRIRLPRDEAVIETECFWFNPTCFPSSLYHWMTAAAAAFPDLRFFHPGTNYIGHGGEPGFWPITPDGRNVSYYRHNDFGGSKSYHILGEYGEFFGGIWEEAAFGYGHFAFYPDKPGMKLWIWSLARDGAIWRDLLTEAGAPQYIEMQTGLLYNQAAAASSLTPFKHVSFPPYGVIHWKEFWFPLKGLKAIVAACPSGGLNVEERKGAGSLLVEFCPVRPFAEEIKIMVDGVVYFREKLQLQPLEVWRREIPLPSSRRKVALDIGEGMLRWQNDEAQRRHLNRPLEPPADFNWTTAEGRFVAGEQLIWQRRFTEARKALEECLQLEPGHLRALVRLAELALRQDEGETALTYARKALSINAYDPEANFVYGAINRRLRRFADALDGFSWASRSLEFRSGAYTEMAEIFFLEGDKWRGEEYLRRAIETNPLNFRAHELSAIWQRIKGKKEEALAAGREILRLEPLNHLARFEAYLLEPTEARRREFIEGIHNELPHETYLELASRYLCLGLEEEAAHLLELAPSHPLVDLVLAYLFWEKDQNKSDFFLERMLKSPFQLVFPFRQEMIPLFEWARQRRPHWKLNYGLALILWNLGREEEAGKLLNSCGQEPDFSPFYLARAEFFSRGKDEKQVLVDIQKAIDLDRRSWRAWHGQTVFYEKKGEDELALKSARSIYPLYPENSIIILDLARALLRNGKARETRDLLARASILPYEGAWEGRDLYRQANLILAAEALGKGKYSEAIRLAEEARKWPENLGAGRPYDPDERIELYLIGLARERQGRRDKAREFMEKVSQMVPEREVTPGVMNLIPALALKKLQQEEKVILWLEKWRAKEADRTSYRWAETILTGNQAAAQKIVAYWLKSHEKKSLWNLAEEDHYWPLLVKINQLAGGLS